MLYFGDVSNIITRVHGGVFLVVSLKALSDFRAAVQEATIPIEELEALTSSSNLGSYCTLQRIEHCFILFVAVLLLVVGFYVPVEQRGIPSLAIALCCVNLAHSEIMISSNTFSVEVFQGEFTELLGAVAYLNLTFGILHSIVGVGTLLGFAKASPAPTTGGSRKGE